MQRHASARRYEAVCKFRAHIRISKSLCTFRARARRS